MRTTIASLFLLLPFVARGQDAEPILGKELREFLGPVPASTVTWRKVRGPDFDVYYGRPNPPLSGGVGFYLGGNPSFTPGSGSKVVSGKLGIFPVQWQRAVASDGSVKQEAVIRLDDYWRVHIWVSGKQQAEVDRILKVVGRLPTFTKKPKPISDGAELEPET